jgi:peptidoglycan/LPS O-acetylase OafA/YrhL
VTQTARPTLAKTPRRADIDYLRVGALLLLILYHVLLGFDSLEWWRVRSENTGHWADYIVYSLTSWRMPLVFFVGGFAARFMLDSMATGAFIRDRAAKLLTAFALAVVVLVPPLDYVRLDNVGAPPATYFDYLLHQAPVAVAFHGAHIPAFAHAWFLPYLFLYSATAALAWRTLPSAGMWLERAVNALPLWIIALALMAWLTFIEAIVTPWKAETRLIIPDITAHLRFVPLFALGFLVAKSETFRAKLQAGRVALWVTAGALLIASLALRAAVIEPPAPSGAVQQASLIVRGLYAGAMLLALTAFAGAFLNKPAPLLTYATDAILPVYLMHQTALILVADWALAQHWPLAAELAALLSAAFLIPLGIYHVLVRPTPWLRVLFGLRHKARGGAAAAGRAEPVTP